MKYFVILAFLAIVGTQVVFWTFTYPANRQTENWTTLPEDWQGLREQWEYSHAASAGLNLVALIAAILAVLAREKDDTLTHQAEVRHGEEGDVEAARETRGAYRPG